MRISDLSSDVCSSDLRARKRERSKESQPPVSCLHPGRTDASVPGLRRALIGGDGFGGLAVADRGSSKHGLFLWLRVDGGSRAAAIARLERVRGDLCGMENGLMVFHRLGPGRRTGCRFGIGRRRRAGGRNDLAARRWDRAARTVLEALLQTFGRFA